MRTCASEVNSPVDRMQRVCLSHSHESVGMPRHGDDAGTAAAPDMLQQPLSLTQSDVFLHTQVNTLPLVFEVFASRVSFVACVFPVQLASRLCGCQRLPPSTARHSTSTPVESTGTFV